MENNNANQTEPVNTPNAVPVNPVQANPAPVNAGIPKKSKKPLIIGLIVGAVLILGAVLAIILLLKNDNPDTPDTPDKPAIVYPDPISMENNGEFAYDFLRQAYAQDQRGENIMVSPYSMDAVWRLAVEGAQGETKQEILDVIGVRSVQSFPQLKEANGLFVRDTFKDQMQPDFVASFVGDLRYDSFQSANAINDWVKEKTDGMINGILDDAPSDDMMLMLLNAIAMDEKWNSTFECDSTRSEEFTKADGETMDTSMMNGDADWYFKTDNAEGVVREYKAYSDGSAFEFVGILPNGDVKEYLSKLSNAEIQAMNDAKIANNSEEADGSVNKVSTGLPRFSYDYSIDKAMEVMQNLGINKAFDKENADFGAMVNLEGSNYESFYIGKVLQKTHIELNERGTKAAAVSALGGMATSAIDDTEYNYYEVDFNKPFVYLIRDKASQEVIFEGIVETPEEWSGSTCSDED